MVEIGRRKLQIKEIVKEDSNMNQKRSIISTSFTSILGDKQEIMTGNERYPIIGDALTEEQVNNITSLFKGLNLYWNCLEKAQIVYSEIEDTVLEIGSVYISERSGKYVSQYGHACNPPYEFHAWTSLNGKILDLALPGVIMQGLKSKDKYGTFLETTKPFILVGNPPANIIYRCNRKIK